MLFPGTCVPELLPVISVYVSHNMINLHATNTMLDSDTLPGDSFVLLLLGGSQFFSFGLLLGPIGDSLSRFVPLKASIFPKLTAFGETIPLLIGGCFIMLLARLGSTENFDFLGLFVGDNDVLDGMALLLTTSER